MLLILFAMGSGLIKSDILSIKAWIVIGVHAGFLTVILLGILLPTSYINKQTMWQMKRLIFLREVYQRIIRDSRILT